MKKLKILFVEDLQTDYELAQWHLRKDNLVFDATCVDTQPEFENALQAFRPDLIISDYSMPEFNGLQALQIKLKKDPEIPFIVLTGSINEETAVECMRSGADDYVLKEKMHRLPFSVRETLKRDAERKQKIQAEQRLIDSEARFREFFESANVGMAIVYKNFTHIVNQAFADMLGYSREALEKLHWQEFTHPEDMGQTNHLVAKLDRGEINSFRHDKRYIHKNGTPVWVDVSVKPHKDENGNLEYFISTIVDVSERKEAEISLRESEKRYQSLFEDSPVSIWEEDFSEVKKRLDDLKTAGVQDFRDYFTNNRSALLEFTKLIKILDMNQETVRIFAAKNKLQLSQELTAIFTEESLDQTINEFVSIAEGKKNFEIEFTNQTLDGQIKYFAAKWAVLPGFEKDLSRVIVSMLDITERKQAEERQQQRLVEMEAMDTITSALRTAQNIKEALPVLLEQILSVMKFNMGSIWLYNENSGKLELATSSGWVNETDNQYLETGLKLIQSTFENKKAYVSNEFCKDTEIFPGIVNKLPPGWGGVILPIFVLEEVLGIIFVGQRTPGSIQDDEVRFLEAISRITGITLQRMILFEDTLRHLKQLQTQRVIDQTIASIFDLNITLDIITTQLCQQVPADAAGILLYSPQEIKLKFAAGNGFWSSIYQHKQLRLGEGIAGKVAIERTPSFFPDLQKSNPVFSDPDFALTEKFVSYYAFPLIAKGQLKGVMEVFFRSYRSAEKEWVDFMESLALQTAIAIENLQMFEELQYSNLELTQAYDATIAGWSRAMDLRDKETEDHTRRVTEMTINMARAMGINEHEIVHMKRGALLHDIGKMGVPDHILLKPGSLSPDEWVIMKQHPVFAYEMISPIEYLKPALDIPYCHHERWDGSGYPRGLKREQIPLSARIFAVIDVWDALSSDRPYRKAWTTDRILDYISEKSGTDFDPKVVKKFLELVSQ